MIFSKGTVIALTAAVAASSASVSLVADAKSPKSSKAGKKGLPVTGTGDPSVSAACAATENGLELFPPRDPKEQKMKLVQSVDTETCTYELSVSWEPDTSIPFVDSPTGTNINPTWSVFTDVPDDFNEICYSEGYDESKTGTVDSPLTPEKHVGLNEHYTEFSYTVFTDDKFAEVTGYQDVVLGAAPCGQGSRFFPGYSVHFYTKGIEERRNYRCNTGGGFFCKTIDEQCSERARDFNMDGDGLTCDVTGNVTRRTNIPPGWVWAVDRVDPVPGVYPDGFNAAAASQGLHAIFPFDFAPTIGDIPQHLLLNYDGELIANHVILWAGFSKGLSRDNKFTRGFNFDDCTSEQYDNIATSVTTEYDPDSGRTIVSAHGSLKDCSGESFTKTVDYSGGDDEDDETEDDEGSCGHNKITLLEAPKFLKAMRFNDTDPNATLAYAGDYDAFQDEIFIFEELTDAYNSYYSATNPPYPFFTPLGLKLGKLLEVAGEHRGTANYIRDQTMAGPASLGGFSPSTASSDIKIDHPMYGTGTIKAFGYAENFGEGVLAITGGTGDFEGAYGTVKPEYGLILLDSETLSSGLAVPNPGFIAGVESNTGELISFGFYLAMDFKCIGTKTTSETTKTTKSTKSTKSSKH
mmetsp:Transcript_886/g.1171  ORF Transcript_886/g.1171 Transcript_886/m.1171 type:complete len:635 (+) Transcript_886:73-1977(+)